MKFDHGTKKDFKHPINSWSTASLKNTYPLHRDVRKRRLCRIRDPATPTWKFADCTRFPGDDWFNGLFLNEIYTKTYENGLVVRIEWQKNVCLKSSKCSPAILDLMISYEPQSFFHQNEACYFQGEGCQSGVFSNMSVLCQY